MKPTHTRHKGKTPIKQIRLSYWISLDDIEAAAIHAIGFFDNHPAPETILEAQEVADALTRTAIEKSLRDNIYSSGIEGMGMSTWDVDTEIQEIATAAARRLFPDFLPRT